MNNYLSYKHTVHYSEIDSVYKLRFDSIISTFQKITLFHSGEMKVDAKTLKEESNAFWVLCKTKFKINKMPIITNVVDVETWPTTVTPLRFYREYQISLDGEPCILGSSEWVTLDVDTRTLRKTETIKYPYDMQHRLPTPGATEFSR